MDIDVNQTLVNAFTDELEKVASTRSIMVGAALGGAAAGLLGQEAYDREEQEDKVRRKVQLLSRRQYEKRKKQRDVKRLISVAAGIGAGAVTPYAYRRAMNHMAESLRGVAKPTLAEWKQANQDFLTHQADYILGQMEARGAGIGQKVGLGVREGLEAGGPPRVRIEHGVLPPGSVKNFFLPGVGKTSKSPVLRAISGMGKQSSVIDKLANQAGGGYFGSSGFNSSGMNQTGRVSMSGSMPSYDKGGTVKKDGYLTDKKGRPYARVHKGEKVVPLRDKIR